MKETFEQMVLRLAHRTCSHYRHGIEPHYSFNDMTLADFTARLRKEIFTTEDLFDSLVDSGMEQGK